MAFEVITIGGATEDIAIYTKEGVILKNKKDILRQNLIAFEFGAKLKVDRAYDTCGGGAANASVCFARLGFKTAILVAVGKDERGRHLRENLRKHGVDVSLVQIVKEYSGFSFLLIGQGSEHVVFSARGANSYLTFKAADMAALSRARWLYLTSLSGKWQVFLKKFFQTRGPLIAWNPGHIQLHAGAKAIGQYLNQLEVLIINKDEALELAVSSGSLRAGENKGFNNVKNLLKILKNMGPRLVLITSGRKGADVYDGKKFYHQPVIKESQRRDTTGVGDAFGSSFVAGLMIYQGDIVRALRLSAKNTASVISQPGAQNGLLKRDSFE